MAILIYPQVGKRNGGSVCGPSWFTHERGARRHLINGFGSTTLQIGSGRPTVPLEWPLPPKRERF